MRLFSLFFLCPLLSFGYTAKSLKLKDYEEMRAIITEHIKKSREKAPQKLVNTGSESAVLELKKGLKVLLMRPDMDNINSSLILMIQNEIANHGAFMPVLKDLAASAVQEFKSKKGSIAHQAGLLYLIENAISYLKPINKPESSEILMDIKRANLKISKKLSNYLILEMERGKTASPSYLAERVLAQRIKENKQAEERKKRAEEEAKQAQKEAEARQPAVEKQEYSVKPTVEVEI